MKNNIENITSLYNKLKKKFINIKKQRDNVVKRNLVLQRALQDRERHIRELKLENEDLLCSKNGTRQNQIAYE